MLYRDQFLCFILVMLLLSSCDFNATKHVKDQKVTGWAVDDNGDSVYMRYNDKGRLSSYTTYKNGLKNGIAKKYYKNGKVQFEIMYKDGLKEGVTKWYYDNGALYRETFYDDGEEEGIRKKYYESGKPMAEIPYRKGVFQPGLKEYTKSGKLKEIYPDLIIQPVDRIAFENTYYLQVYFEGKPKGTTYYRVIKNNGSNWESLEELPEKQGVGLKTYRVDKGGFIMQKEIFRGEFKTTLRNTYVVCKEFNLAIDN